MNRHPGRRRHQLIPAWLLLAGCANGELVVVDAAVAVGDALAVDIAAAPDAATGDQAAPLADLPAREQSVPILDAAVDAAVGGCPAGMVHIGQFCVDRYEAQVVDLVDGGARPHSPFATIGATPVRATVAAGVMPQGYISQLQAAQACANAGKRLCSASEFALACRGADPADYYPYGGKIRQKGACNEGKGSSMTRFFGNDASKWTYAQFNDPRLNQWDGGLAATGSHARCVSPAGVADCVGNLHEWGSDAPDAKRHGRFRGGFYGDAEINGPGCLYVTSAHEPGYHDYSTGFRCCRDAQ